MVTQLELPPSTQSSSSSSHSLNRIIEGTFSYNGNIMLAAIISLLVVILFVLLLHLYARWFLAQARQRRRSSMSASHVLGPSRFHHFHTFTFETTTLSDSPTKGLDPTIIASIPVFVYINSQDHHHDNNDKHGLECVICLSVFEENEVGKKLPKCGHAFHVDCIDMWLHSHSSCPICRAPVVVVVVCEKNKVVDEVGELSETGSGDVGLVDGGDSTLEIAIEIPGSSSENDSLSAPSSSMSQSMPLGCSFKRMLSRNRSLECKVHPSCNVHELEA